MTDTAKVSEIKRLKQKELESKSVRPKTKCQINNYADPVHLKVKKIMISNYVDKETENIHHQWLLNI